MEMLQVYPQLLGWHLEFANGRTRLLLPVAEQ
jgi:hypothetical protein